MEDSKYASRKFLLAIILCINGIIALWFAKLDGSAFNALQLGVLGLYMAANVAQKSVVDSSVK